MRIRDVSFEITATHNSQGIISPKPHAKKLLHPGHAKYPQLINRKGKHIYKGEAKETKTRIKDGK